MQLQDYIKSCGYDFVANQFDGHFKEFNDALGNKGWYIGRETPTGKLFVSFGDWKTNKHFTFKSDGLTEEEKNDFATAQKQFIEKKTERQFQAKKNVSDIFTRFEQRGSEGQSKYLESKKLPARIPGTIVKPSDSGHALVIPMRDEHGEIWNFQTIFDNADKIYFNFARVEGLFFEIPAQPGPDGSCPSVTYVCEGFATGYALAQATGCRVIVAFTLSNLKHVAPKFPNCVLALDNDASTKQKMIDSGHTAPVNPGRDIGGKLAHELGLMAVMPPGDVSVDYADLWVQGGKAAVLEGLLALDLSEFDSVQTPPPAQKLWPSAISRWVNGLEPMEIRYSKKGKMILPLEVEVAERLYSYYEGHLIKFETDIFKWTGKVWQCFEETDVSHVMQQIMVLLSGFGTHSKFKSIYKIFETMVPHTKRNMFYVNPQRVTFNNGTLAIDLLGGKWVLNFREHRKDDYSTNLIPYEYIPDAKNPVFEETLHNILGDKEFDTKIRAVKQMFGATLAPLYPRLFLLVGKAGSGKSTLITLATALVSEGNVCSVQPSQFEGFHLEPMAGKLINAVTDLNVVKPIADEVVKQIEDRVPVAINRKHKAIIRAPFPAVHIFGANDIPPTLERGSMAHTRRWTFIPCDHFQRAVKEHDKDRVQRIKDAGMAGVINFAIEGLKDLLDASGHFFVPDSGQEKMRKWQVENDPISSFFEAIRDGDVPDLTLEAEARCYTKVLWERFVGWHDDAYGHRPRIPKQKFLSKLENSLNSREKYCGSWVFRGVASVSVPVRYPDQGISNSLKTQNSLNDAGMKLHENSSENF